MTTRMRFAALRIIRAKHYELPLLQKTNPRKIRSRSTRRNWRSGNRAAQGPNNGAGAEGCKRTLG